MILFILLSPGLLLTIPRVARGRTSFQAILVHALIFAVAVYTLKPVLEKFKTASSKEGFSVGKNWMSLFGGVDATNARVDLLVASWALLLVFIFFQIFMYKAVPDEKFMARTGPFAEEVAIVNANMGQTKVSTKVNYLRLVQFIVEYGSLAGSLTTFGFAMKGTV